MSGPNKTYIVQLPMDADFKAIRTEAYEKGGVLHRAHQNNSKEGFRAHKLNASEDVLKWFKQTFCEAEN